MIFKKKSLRLHENILNKSILLIGNGPSVHNYRFGREIDRFKNIARINNFKTIGYENIIGSKTTIWCNGANQNLNKRTYTFSQVIVFIPPNIQINKSNYIHDHIQKRLLLNKNQYKLISIDKMKFYEKKCNSLRLTTGTNSILWAIENFEKVIIHGFDFFQNGKEHYYDNRFKKWLYNQSWIKKGGKHNLVVEKEYINKLIRGKKIYQLKDFTNVK